jgi:hypothetical protein
MSHPNDPEPSASAHARPHARVTAVQARRRIALRLGLLTLVAACVTACIFEKGDYQGGGRLDKGATANTASGAASDAAPPADTTDAATD